MIKVTSTFLNFSVTPPVLLRVVCGGGRGQNGRRESATVVKRVIMALIPVTSQWMLEIYQFYVITRLLKWMMEIWTRAVSKRGVEVHL